MSPHECEIITQKEEITEICLSLDRHLERNLFENNQIHWHTHKHTHEPINTCIVHCSALTHRMHFLPIYKIHHIIDILSHWQAKLKLDQYEHWHHTQSHSADHPIDLTYFTLSLSRSKQI